MKFIYKFLSAVVIVFAVVFFKVNASAETSNYDDVYMDDEHIVQILKLAYSVEEFGTCGINGTHQVTEEDIKEFKIYYEAEKRERAGGYSSYFKSNTGWVQRSDGVTLSCHYYPSSMYVSGDIPNARAARFATAFRLLKERHSSSPHWKNTASMEAQFLCHAFTIGAAKNPWNIEPWRTEASLVRVTAKLCNP